MRFAYIKFNNAVSEYKRLVEENWSEQDGGPEAYVSNVLRFSGKSPTLIVSFHTDPRYSEAIHKDDLTIRSLYWPRRSGLGSMAHRVLVILQLAAYLVRFRPTHIYCWQTNLPLLISFLVARIYRAYFVPSRHTRFPGKYDAKIHHVLGKVDRCVVRRSRAVICHGPYLRQDLIDCGVAEANIHEFNWGYSHLLEEINITDTGKCIVDGSEKRVLFVGRITSQKGVFDLLNAAEPLFNSTDGIRLLYAGMGTEFEELKAEVEKRGLGGRVELLGRVNHRDLSRLIVSARMVVTPSRQSFPEGRCMAAIEGLILGVPVVAPDYGPFPYLIKHGVNGLLYQPDSVVDLRNAIKALLVDVQLHKKVVEGAKMSAGVLAEPKVRFFNALESAFRVL